MNGAGLNAAMFVRPTNLGWMRFVLAKQGRPLAELSRWAEIFLTFGLPFARMVLLGSLRHG